MALGRLNPDSCPSYLVSPPSRIRWSQASIVIDTQGQGNDWAKRGRVLVSC